VRKAAETLNYETKSATVVLVTDGQETCGGTPCELADHMLVQGRDITVHVIGFKLRPNIPTFRVPNQVMPTDATPRAICLAAVPGGKFVTAETGHDLSNALQDTLGCKVYGRHPWTQLASKF
jgi:Ca-activated chloride channel family protein